MYDITMVDIRGATNFRCEYKGVFDDACKIIGDMWDPEMLKPLSELTKFRVEPPINLTLYIESQLIGMARHLTEELMQYRRVRTPRRPSNRWSSHADPIL